MSGIDITLKWKPDEDTHALLIRMLGKLSHIEELMANTDQVIAALVAKVTEHGTVIESAVTLITGLSAALEAAKDDPAQLQAVIDQVNTQSAALAAAVAANTPAAPAA